MSTENINITEIRFHFFIKIDEFEKDYWSHKVVLCGIPWRVRVCKRLNSKKEDVVDVLLVCSPKTSLDWNCHAKATITLHSSKSEQPSYVKNFPKCEFKKDSASNGLTSFMSWSDFQRYVYNDQICVGVLLAANPPFYVNESEILQTSTRFLFNVNNISKLESKSSAEMKVGGTAWYINLRRKDGYLAVYTHESRNPLNQYWTWEMKCSLKLLSFDESRESVQREFDHCYNLNSRGWGFSKFLHWDTFIDPTKKYVSKDKAVFEIELKVSQPKPLWNIDQEARLPVNVDLECSICLLCVIGREPVITKCGHLFCDTCIRRALHEQKKCPLCNSVAVQTDLRAIYL